LAEVSVNTRDTARYSNDYYKISPQIFAEISAQTGISLGSAHAAVRKICRFFLETMLKELTTADGLKT